MARPVQLFMFCAVYGPSSLILVACYGYVYLVARGHARAISVVRHSLHQPPGSHSTTVCPPRYGLALAITTGMFLALWLPFQVIFYLYFTEYNGYMYELFFLESLHHRHFMN